MMPIPGFTETGHLWLFALLVFGIIVTPGMDMAFVLARGLAGGRRAGLTALAGIVAGGATHTLMASLGIGLLLQAAPGAFTAMLIAGSVYVAWIGWSLFRGAGALGSVAAGAPMPLTTVFSQAAATCLMNPKAYLFMIAVFPQFLRPGQGPLGAQALTLGVIIAVTQTLVYGAVAILAGTLSSRLASNAGAQRLIGRSVGLMLVGTAVWALWAGWSGL
jgi:threonine/homoserine/homoserine lactone efflux protein